MARDDPRQPRPALLAGTLVALALLFALAVVLGPVAGL